MGKIVKYCSSCEEGFSAKFSFCPNCASELSAYEMQPVADKTKAKNSAEAAESPAETKVADVPPMVSPPAETVSDKIGFENVDLFEDSTSEVVTKAESFEIEIPQEDPAEMTPETPAMFTANDPVEEVPSPEPEVSSEPELIQFAPEATEPAASPAKVQVPENSHDYLPARGGDDNYAVTVISERNTGTRNGLLLGSFSLIVVGFCGVMIYSLFNNLDDIPALNEDPNLIAYLNDTPISIEEDQKTESEDKDDDGGGGGGGKQEKTPMSDGVRPPMMQNPTIAPSSRMDRVTDPELAIQAGIEGPIDETERIEGRYGAPSLNTTASDGDGEGGGMGSGRGRGVGPGDGGGFGPGANGGMGGGDNGGIGPGSGGGGRDRQPPASGPSTGMVILSKPRPGYTEAARKNSVTGTVRLRVTFNANGTIGSITPVTRLGFGLTENAIAAARSIRFKPEMRNGRAVGVKKTIAYNFSIY